MWYYAAAFGVKMAKQKPKAKGTQAETDVVNWAKKHEFFRAERLALKGSDDVGDVRIAGGPIVCVMVQVKDGYTDKKEPTDFQIGQWLEETEKQRRRGGWDIALLVHKRFGKGDPDNWRWYVDGPTFAALTVGQDRMHCVFPPYVQLQGYMIPPLLRQAGVQ